MVTSNDLQTMKSILIKSGKWDGHALDAYTARDNGKKFTDQEHLKGIIYALLTCNRPWYIVVPYLNEIDELFCHYDFMRYASVRQTIIYTGSRMRKESSETGR